jgi:8-oxo-dGTP pyrophosphatase MutT (NUDIX family)
VNADESDPNEFGQDANRLGQSIARRLSSKEPLPRSIARMSLAYGRHRGPAPVGTRRAAVVVALYKSPAATGSDQWIIPLTLRPRTLQHHGGQISLPGGRIEPGEDAYTAALREFDEELGIQPQVLQRCGELSSQYVFASGNLVRPVVTIVQAPDQPWKPDPVEVEKVIELPLSVLTDGRHRVRPTRQIAVRNQGREVGSLTMETPAIDFEDHHIWGATALILDQLAQILRPIV